MSTRAKNETLVHGAAPQQNLCRPDGALSLIPKFPALACWATLCRLSDAPIAKNAGQAARASSQVRDCIQMGSAICYRPTKTSNGNVVQIFKACSSCRPPRYFPRGGGKMRKPLMELTAGIVAVLILSLFAAPQSQPPKRPTTPGGPESLYDKLGDTGSGGSAPRRDLPGFWAGRVAARINPVPAMTPW